MRNSKQGGFTLIELVVVIVILGILAAFAVPRFMGLETQARIASVNALEGSLRSAAAMAHGVALASGNPATITVEGNSVTITNGYPDKASLNNIMDSSILGAAPGRFTFANGVYTLNGAATPANCSVTYANATTKVVNGVTYTVPPAITTSTTKC